MEEDNQKLKSNFKKLKKVKVFAWMVLIGGAIHNFMNGIAIGVAFSRDVAQGIGTGLAIFCHEISHELGKLNCTTVKPMLTIPN